MHVPPDSAESLELLTTVWRATALDRNPGADTRDLPGIAVRWADCRFPFWNSAMLTDAGADAALTARRLNEAADIMRTKERPGFLWVFEDLLDDTARAALPEAARRAGLEHAFPGTGMAADLPYLPEPAHPDLRFVRVATEEHLRAYAEINARAYGLPLEDGRDGLADSTLWKHQVYAYLGIRDDGEPVTCAATVEADGRLFVLLVATVPGWERRGYGEAVTRKALYEGALATGLTRAVLQATTAGAPVYPRIGFRPNSAVGFFSLRG